ncbi:ribonuclease III [bacterium]|nr:ribonuclease III [bacterium]
MGNNNRSGLNAGELVKCEASLGTSFSDKQWLLTALTHKSYVRVSGATKVADNERLEFFGDAVVKLLVSEYLLHEFPTYSEGELTKLRAQLVSDRNLAYMAERLGVGHYLQMSFGETNTGGRTRQSNLANAMEAILGAYFLDRGIDVVRRYFVSLLQRFQGELLSQDYATDYKTTLQEFAQRRKGALPDYRVLKEEGPEHEKVFSVEVSITLGQGPQHFSGIGRSKKLAEQQAAKSALIGLHLI